MADISCDVSNDYFNEDNLMPKRLALLFAFLCILLTSASAQELVKAPETNVEERVRLLESELERQNTKLDQLQRTLTEQQQTIQALLEKLSAQTNLASSAATTKETAVADAPAPAESQTATVEQRLAKVEGQV